MVHISILLFTNKKAIQNSNFARNTIIHLKVWQAFELKINKIGQRKTYSTDYVNDSLNRTRDFTETKILFLDNVLFFFPIITISF